MKARILWATLGLTAAVAVGCGGAPGSSSSSGGKSAAPTTTPISTEVAKPDISKLGNVTLSVWDQQVRGGQNAEVEELNKQFMAKYPNVTIKRTKKSFEDLQKTLKLAVSGTDAPDVVQANQGYGQMGAMVKAKLLRPITDYAKVYGWNDRYSQALLDLNSFSSDGKQFGSGDLYGLSQNGEIVGVFYNKQMVPNPPTTLDEFEKSLADFKAKGMPGIEFGNLEAWPGIHEFESVLGQTADKDAVRNFVFGKQGASFDTPEFQAGAAKLVDWTKKGYINKNFAGTKYDPAWQAFAKGKSPYTIAGTWITADAEKMMGDKLGFMLMPGKDPSAPVVARRRGSPVGDHLERQAARRGRGLPGLPHRRQRGQGAGGHREPAAGHEGLAGADLGDRGRGRQRVAEAQRRRRPDPVPGLHDADVLRRHLQRDPEPARRQAGPGRLHQGRAVQVREVQGIGVT